MALPHSPQVVYGVLDIAGEMVPAVSARRRFGLPDQPIDASNQFVLVRAGKRMLAIVVDEAQGLFACNPQDLVPFAGEALQGVQADGIARLPDGLAVITNATRFLFPAEFLALDEALGQAYQPAPGLPAATP